MFHLFALERMELRMTNTMNESMYEWINDTFAKQTIDDTQQL